MLAVEHGADGIVVSNHGGRQLDSCPASLDALPEVVEAVAGRLPVLMDGGVRRGTDVLKAIALGAVGGDGGPAGRLGAGVQRARTASRVCSTSSEPRSRTRWRSPVAARSRRSGRELVGPAP